VQPTSLWTGNGSLSDRLNPGGPHKKVDHVRELTKTYTTAAIEALVEIMREGKPDRARAAAAEALLYRGRGQAPQHLEVDGIEPLQIVSTIYLVDGQTGEAKRRLRPTGRRQRPETGDQTVPNVRIPLPPPHT
jgi:hypothetical protein